MVALFCFSKMGLSIEGIFVVRPLSCFGKYTGPRQFETCIFPNDSGALMYPKILWPSQKSLGNPFGSNFGTSR